MTNLQWNNGQNVISNENGLQLKGSKSPNKMGLSPKELLEAALALCISISLEKVLERDEIEVDLNELSIQVIASKADGVTSRFTHFHTTVKMPQKLEEAYKKKLLTIVEHACTIGNTISKGAVISVVEK